ncbi:hypothetical protein C0J52_07726 [Blattella germanica]|nr:hypothetical protein C0J52_07726 [Blattella germanica]
MKYGLIIGEIVLIPLECLNYKKKAVRILTDSASTEHCRPLFIKMKLLTLTSLYIKYLFLFIKDNINKYDNRSDFHLLSKTQDSFESMALKVAYRFPPELFLLVKSEFVTKINYWLLINPFYTIKEFFN